MDTRRPLEFPLSSSLDASRFLRNYATDFWKMGEEVSCDKIRHRSKRRSRPNLSGNSEFHTD